MFRLNKILIIAAAVLISSFDTAFAQAYKWMNIGSLQSFYYDIGCEIEVARNKDQQDGLQWPAIYRYQDMSAAHGLWIGAKDFTDAVGNWPYRVIHIGPRVTGRSEFFPVRFKLYSKFEAPVVTVDGNFSMSSNDAEIDSIDPSMPYDRLIVAEVNSLLGITMVRKVFQFSNPYFDNFIVSDYTFTNTGNTDADPEIELPNNDLKDVVFYFNHRWAMCYETRYVIGNGSGWGMNTMNDVRGDGLYVDPPGENFRTSFAWHGYWPARVVAYDNIGGPIWKPDPYGYVAEDDTVGRLGAPQFMGVLTLYADKSVDEKVDDLNQPSVTRYEGSDIPAFSNNDAFDQNKMTGEYKMITREDAPAEQRARHSYVVDPDAIGKDFLEFANQRNPPEIGTPGGYSSVVTYGKYNIPFGKSVHIIFVEGAAGLDREHAIEMGKKFKQGLASDLVKDQYVLTGKDSLMQTWRRTTASYNNNWNLSQAPKPPREFSVKSNNGRISLNWSVFEDDPNVTGFEIYRASSKYDSTYYLIRTAGKGDRTYDDTTGIRGIDYYYYILTVGQDDPGDATLNIPPHKVKSGRYYTQTYDPANLKRAAETTNVIRVVPNPLVLTAAKEVSFNGQETEPMKFFGVPARCTIKIYTELGELIDTIEKDDPSSDVPWAAETEFRQLIVSGIYIAVVTNNDTGEKSIVKFAVIR